MAIQTAFILGFLVMVQGCTTTATTTVTAEDFSKGIQVEGETKVAALVPGDSVEVSVEVDGRMEVASYQAGINHLGMITLPLVGDVKVGGMTVEGARAVLAQTYGAYFVNPPVIMVSRMSDSAVGEWGFVTVTGRVGQPGRIKIPSAKGIRLTTAINESGGFGPSAKTSDIQVTRAEEDGRKIRVSINYNDIGQDGNDQADVSLFDGDIVYVPQRIF
ncbi:polysaccharide biosynthesis/export family protein [Pontiellaceae bacterium B1224]|nr:polysaccharide biosynthesis/export family protein [Pontiellaceae bacterium B1224]